MKERWRKQNIPNEIIYFIKYNKYIHKNIFYYYIILIKAYVKLRYVNTKITFLMIT